MLAGVIKEISHSPLRYIPVTREEEAVGIASGCAVAGKKPLILMQNSGLGNSINALLSLTYLYKLPLFLLMSHRGGKKEKIVAQVPMGKATPKILNQLGIKFIRVNTYKDLDTLQSHIHRTYKENRIHAALLSQTLWE